MPDALRSCRRVSAVAGVLLALAGGAAVAQVRAVVGGSYVAPDGSIHEGGAILIRDGKIGRVVPSAPADVPTDAYAGAVVCPGLVDCWSALSAWGQLQETQDPLQPRARAADALDRHHRHLGEALRAGVTTFALLPSERNLIGGSVAICQTSGAGGAAQLLASENPPVSISLSPAAFQPDREPTSRSGAIGVLRDALDSAARGGAGDPLAGVVGGKASVLMVAPTGADVLAALELAGDRKLKLVLRHDADARDVASSVERGQIVVVGPLPLDSPRRRARAAALFEAAGANVAICGMLPAGPADGLRIGAATAASAGLSPEAARRAITIAAAEVLGVGDQLGSIREGARADLVVFTGDPLDMRSRVLAVYAGGQRVYVAPPAKE